MMEAKVVRSRKAVDFRPTPAEDSRPHTKSRYSAVAQLGLPEDNAAVGFIIKSLSSNVIFGSSVHPKWLQHLLLVSPSTTSRSLRK